ncbi:MAG: hypothetical protein Q4F57_05070 [Weeksellaceae bacterium]|nr:hypothetical protein [Weeksellaceae bacterium]
MQKLIKYLTLNQYKFQIENDSLIVHLRYNFRVVITEENNMLSFKNALMPFNPITGIWQRSFEKSIGNVMANFILAYLVGVLLPVLLASFFQEVQFIFQIVIFVPLLWGMFWYIYYSITYGSFKSEMLAIYFTSNSKN